MLAGARRRLGARLPVAAALLAGTPAAAGRAGALATVGSLAVAAGLPGRARRRPCVAEWRSAARAGRRRCCAGCRRRRRGWRADMVDLVVVAARRRRRLPGPRRAQHDGEPSVLALLAPGLVGLAVALLVARAAAAGGGPAGAAALRAGRPGAALAALHLARRPGTHRVFAVLAVAVAPCSPRRPVLAHGVGGLVAAGGAGAGRGPGADRTGGRTARSCWPRCGRSTRTGAYAMAVARTTAVPGRGPRRRRGQYPVGRGRPAARAYGRPAADLAALLHPPARPAPTIRRRPVDPGRRRARPSLDADVTVTVRLHLSTVDGEAPIVDFGPLAAGRRVYAAWSAAARPAAGWSRWSCRAAPGQRRPGRPSTCTADRGRPAVVAPADAGRRDAGGGRRWRAGGIGTGGGRPRGPAQR